MEATSPVLGPDGEAAVFALAGQAVLEDHHRGDDVVALQVGDVVALDAQRRLVEVERVGDLLQRLAAGGQVAGPADLVLASDSLALRSTVSISDFLSPRCGTRTSTRRAALLRQQLGDRLGVGRQRGHEDLAGHVDSAPASPYICSRNCSTSSPGEVSSTLSTTQPRWPRMRPPRT